MDTLKTSLGSSTTTAATDDDLRASKNASEQARFVTEHSTCAMCDSVLDIRHESDRTLLKVKEEAHCPSCGIRVRTGQHLMH